MVLPSISISDMFVKCQTSLHVSQLVQLKNSSSSLKIHLNNINIQSSLKKKKKTEHSISYISLSHTIQSQTLSSRLLGRRLFWKYPSLFLVGLIRFGLPLTTSPIYGGAGLDMGFWDFDLGLTYHSHNICKYAILLL